MAVTPISRTVRRFAPLLTPGRADSDGELLRAFHTVGDHAAFAELLRRHGRLVRSVCRRVLGDRSGSDDAWQATFLILACRARSLTGTMSLAGWLHGVAYRTALNERRASRRRIVHEGAAPVGTVPPPERVAIWRELQELVDAEVRRLPDRLREVFVRCALENEGCVEVGAELGLNAGTVRGRLAQARRVLRARLGRRDVSLSAALALAAVTADRLAAGLAAATAGAAVAVVTGRGVPSGVSARALALAAGRGTGFVRRVLVAVLLAVGAVGVFGLGQPVPKPADPATPKTSAPAPETAPAAAAEALPAGAIARFGTNRFRTGCMVSSLAFSPDGKRLASWGNGMYKHDQFTLWDAENGKEIRSARTSEYQFFGLAWPADGRGVAVIKGGGSVGVTRTGASDLTVWEFTAEAPTELPAPGSPGPPQVGIPGGAGGPLYNAVAISIDGTRIAAATTVGGKPDVVVVFALKPAKSLKELKRLVAFDAPPALCKALAFTPDGKRLVGACAIEKDGKATDAGTMVIWDAAGKISRTIDTPAGAIQWDDINLAVSDKMVAVGKADGDTFVADLAAGTAKTVRTGHQAKEKTQGSGVFALAFSPDGKTLATVGPDGMVRLTDVAAGTVTREFGPHRNWPQAVAFTTDGKRLASAGQDGVIRVWDTTNGKEAVPTGGHPCRVRVSASADGKVIATVGGDDVFRIWDPATGTERQRIAAGGAVNFYRLTPDGRQVVAVVGPWDKPDKALKVWDTATGADATPAGFPKSLPASGFQFTPDGKTLVTYHDEKLAAWAWPGGTKLWAADMPKPANPQGINQVNSVAISPDGRHFATVANRYWYREDKGLHFGYGADGVVDLWETATGKRVRRLVESESCFRPAAFAADGTLIHCGGGRITGDMRGGQSAETKAQICVLDPLTGRLLREFSPSGRPDGVNSGHAIALSGDGRVLFRSTDMGEVQLFEVATGKFRTALPGHRDTVLALDAPANDVRRVVSGSSDTTALLWNLGFGGTKGPALTADDRKTLWAALADPDGTAGYAAMVKLAGDPSGLVILSGAELRPAPAGPMAADLAPLFKDLDANAFTVREAAAAALDKFGESAIGLVRSRLEMDSSAEVRDRLTKFLDRHDRPPTDPERLRQGRALELLEHLGTVEARGLLEKLAAGGPARLTTDAMAAVARLAKR